MTEKQMETFAEKLKDELGHEMLDEFIKILTDTNNTCPLGTCDGTGKVEHTTFDTDVHAYINDGEERCECIA